MEFVEKAPGALKVLRANLAKLGITGNFQIHCGTVAAALKRLTKAGGTFDLIFLDPPYDAAAEYEAALRSLDALLAPGGLAIAEHRRKEKLSPSYGCLERSRLLEQGDAALSFFRPQAGGMTLSAQTTKHACFFPLTLKLTIMQQK